jgi:glycine/D-amino acid oxidase-like deaminating enzyme
VSPTSRRKPAYEWFWSDDCGPARPRPPLDGRIRADVVIVGGGFTGLSAAINLRQRDPGLSVVLLEQEQIGFGASGRNSGWVWPNLTTYDHIHETRGLETLRETYRYARRACDYVQELVQAHGLDSDFRVTGLLRPSVGPAWEPDRLAYAEFCDKLGRGDQIREMDEHEVANEIRSPLFHRGLCDKELALIQPLKHARALAKLAESLGVLIHEHTPVMRVDETADRVVARARSGEVVAGRALVATNAWTHLFAGGACSGPMEHERPVFLYNVMSEVLAEAQWDQLGWRRRNAVYTFGPGAHFGSPTRDGRLHWCSDRFATVPFGRSFDHDTYAGYKDTMVRQTTEFFPTLAGVRLTHHWGGPVAVTPDRIFHLGYTGRHGRVVMSVGCNGNGVSLTHLNGRIAAELLTDRRSELCDLWFVNRKPTRWPGGWLPALAIRIHLAREDAANRRRARAGGLDSLVTP